MPKPHLRTIAILRGQPRSFFLKRKQDKNRFIGLKKHWDIHIFEILDKSYESVDPSPCVPMWKHIWYDMSPISVPVI